MIEEWPDSILPPTKEEFEKLAEKTIDHAIARWRSQRTNARKYFKSLKNSYNGIMDEKLKLQIETIYKIPNRAKYKDFRLSRNKVDIITGEFLLRPIKSVPQILSPEAVSERQNQINIMLGMYYAQKSIKDLQESGIDITGGLPIPGSEEEAIELGGYKHKAEIFYEILIQWLFKNFPTKESFFSGLQNMVFCSESFAQIKTSSSGHPIIETFDPEDAIYEEVPNDPFLTNTPVFGRRIMMTKNQILKTFKLSPEEKDTLTGWFSNVGNSDDMEISSTNNVSTNLCAVYHLEFKLLKLWTLKEEVRNGKYRMSDLSHNYVYKNKGTLLKDQEKGKHTVDIKVKEYTYEGYRIGESIYKNVGLLKNQPASINKPFESHFTYTGVLFNTVNHSRVPFYALMEEAKEQYNLVRYSINKELGKLKGVVFGYNRVLLPKNSNGKAVSMNEILWRLVNDGFIDYSTAAEHNYMGKDIQMSDFFKPMDLGISSSLQQLIMLGQDLERLMDRISGVNDNREGQTNASETATNATNNIISSRTITEPMMFFYDRFIENTLKKYIAFSGQIYAKNPDLIREFAGDKAAMFIESSEDIGIYDIGLYIENTREMQDVRSRVQKYIDTSVQAGQLPIPEAFEAEIASTVSEATAKLRQGWIKMQEIAAAQQKAEAEAAAAEQSRALDAEIMAREDSQQHDRDQAVSKGIMKAADTSQKGRIKSKQMQKQS